MKARLATVADADAIATIYNEGIEDRIATFETRLRTADDVRGWLGTRFPVVVVESDTGGILSFASTSEYRPRECYSGVAEVSVYTARAGRGRGAGRLALQAVIDAAGQGGFWKLLSRVFPENTASRAMVRSCGFREVGTYERHARLDGTWRDVIIVELTL